MSSSAFSESINVIHPVRISRGKNAEVWDTFENRYIDFVGGIGVLNVGHCHPEVVRSVCGQTETLMHSAFNAVPHDGYYALVDRLRSFVPVDYPLVSMLTNSGAEAAENALKVARAATGRQGVIAFDDGFHGRTLAALNLNGKVKPYKSSLGTLPGPVHHVPFPSKDNHVSVEEAMKAFERLFDIEVDPMTVGAVFVEPVQGEGGFQTLDPDFVEPLMNLCRRHGILLVLDEIQSGFGRTGSPFAFNQLGLVPDLLLMGKSMAAGLPLASVSGREWIMNTLPKGGLGGTFSGNAVSCAAACTVIDIMSRPDFFQSGVMVEKQICTRYQKWKANDPSNLLGGLTGMGAMRGIVFNDTGSMTGADHLAEVIRHARDSGLLLMPSGRHKNVLRLLPPLTVEPELLDEGLQVLERTVNRQIEQARLSKMYQDA